MNATTCNVRDLLGEALELARRLDYTSRYEAEDPTEPTEDEVELAITHLRHAAAELETDLLSERIRAAKRAAST